MRGSGGQARGLGGVYALKHALRYLALEPDDRCAIVVSADIAEYARGSSGEPTQGAGAVAMLVERQPKLLTVHLEHIGSASSYRAVDFRKPVLRNILRGKLNCHFQDLPVFNGGIDDVLSGRDAARLERHDAAHGPRTRRILSRAFRGVHAPSLSPNA